ncbi:MAG: dTDP-4-dehydrorhamnose 3,5-epimerase [Acidobacteria bacterium]|nr:dTDP-4-dehydrorhamnose 3,5-epimerase [Acidobacteriota bacterium]
MIFNATPLPGAYVVEVEPLRDARGFFARTFCLREFASVGFRGSIVQVNHSRTRRKGTIRGMHYQAPPACEAKIIRCIRGTVFDVMLDLRRGSPTFLRWHGVELSAASLRTVFIPEGFAHGFQALTAGAEMLYLHSAYYSPDHERGLRFDDPAAAIRWPLPPGPISPRDRGFPPVGRDFEGVQP